LGTEFQNGTKKGLVNRFNFRISPVANSRRRSPTRILLVRSFVGKTGEEP